MSARKKPDAITVIALVACALVLVGEVVVYSQGAFGYSADADFDASSVSYSITVSGDKVYSAVLTENSVPCSRLYIYADTEYLEHYEDVRDSGVRKKDMAYTIDQLVKSLGMRGSPQIEIREKDTLATRMSSDLGNANGKGLLVLSYALPSEVYTGNAGDLLMKWISAGGKLYWCGGEIGRYYTENGTLKTVEGNQELFFGKKCVNTGKDVVAYSKIDAGGLTDALSLKCNNVRFGLDTSVLTGAASMGYSQNGYSSVSSVKYGSGIVCVIAGDYDYNQRDDIAQIISSGITCDTKVLDIDNGSAGRGVSRVSLPVPAGAGKLCLFISVGGAYHVYGGAFLGN